MNQSDRNTDLPPKSVTEKALRLSRFRYSIEAPVVLWIVPFCASACLVTAQLARVKQSISSADYLPLFFKSRFSDQGHFVAVKELPGAHEPSMDDTLHSSSQDRNASGLSGAGAQRSRYQHDIPVGLKGADGHAHGRERDARLRRHSAVIGGEEHLRK